VSCVPHYSTRPAADPSLFDAILNPGETGEHAGLVLLAARHTGNGEGADRFGARLDRHRAAAGSLDQGRGLHFGRKGRIGGGLGCDLTAGVPYLSTAWTLLIATRWVMAAPPSLEISTIGTPAESVIMAVVL